MGDVVGFLSCWEVKRKNGAGQGKDNDFGVRYLGFELNRVIREKDLEDNLGREN